MSEREYQLRARTNTAEIFKTEQSALIVMATGTGKTHVFSHIIQDVPGRAFVMAHRTELIEQAAEKITNIVGCDVQIEKAEQYASRLYPSKVVVGSVQTMARGRYKDFDPYKFNLFVLDEAHHGVSNTNKMVIEHFAQNPNCKILGVTATPDRTDEKALGMVFKNVAMDYGICEGIQDGWLVPIEQNEVFVEGLDFSGIKTAMGDLANNELAAIMEFEQNLHEVASSTIQIAGDRKTLVFAASVAQAERLAEIFNRHKPGSANYVTGKTCKDIRADMFKNYARKGFQYLINVGVATEGFDDPGVEVVCMARPTKSRCLYTQCCGRGTRPAGEIAYQLNECETPEERQLLIAQSMKPKVEIIDFVGNCGRHKLVNAADILGGKYDDEIVEIAKAEVTRRSKEGEPVEILSELAKAENELARRRKEAVDAAKRGELTLKATFKIRGVDPFDALGIVPARIPGWAQGKEATEKQVAFLKRMNIDAVGMNSGRASQLIGEIIERGKGLFPFGKHEGKPIAEVPRGYLNWFLAQEWSYTKKDLRAEVCKVLGVAS